MPPEPDCLALGRGEDGVDLLVGHRNFVDDRVELRLGLGGESIDGFGDFANDRGQRRSLLDFGHHALARLLFDFRQLVKHLAAFGRIGDVARDGSAQHGAQVLRAVGQRRIGADADALHALRAILRNVERRFAAGDVLGCGVACGCGNYAHGRKRRGRLVVAEVRTELGVEGFDGGDWRARPLPLGRGVRTAAGAGGAGRLSEFRNCDFFKDGQQRLAAEAGVIGCGDFADRDLFHALEALQHDFHVRLHDGFAQLAELLHILLVDDLAELLLRDAELLQHGADREKCAEKRVALHAQLQIGAIGGFARDVEAGQREDANLFFDNLLARPDGQVLPGVLTVHIRLPHQAAALLHSVERVGVREGLGIAAKHDGYVAQVAVDANAFLGRDHEVAGRRALLLRAVLGIGADVNHFLGIAQRVHFVVALVEQIVEVAENRAEIFAGGNRAPAADGMEAHGDCALGQQRRRFVGDDAIGVVDAENDKVRAIGRGLAVFARPAGGHVLECADDVLGAEVARTEAVAAAEEARHFGKLYLGQAVGSLHCFRKRGADVAAEGIVAGQRLVGAFEDDDVLLALESVDERSLREGANHVHVNRTYTRLARFPQIIDRGLDVLGCRSKRNKHGVRVGSFVLADQPVAAAGELGELLVGLFKKLQNRLGKVVAPRDHALHVVFLVLHRAEQDGIGQIHHLGHAAARGAEENALRLGGAVDDVVGRAEILADQLRLVLVEGALEVRGQEAVHDVHARRERELGHAAQDQRLVGGLLRVFAEEHDPAGVERAIDIVVAAVHVEGVLGERARAHFEHHRRSLARRVIVLLHAVDHALARR